MGSSRNYACSKDCHFARRADLPAPDFASRVRRCNVDIEGTPFEQLAVRKSESRNWRDSMRNKSLLFLLHLFRNKHWALPHDRIFSLLSVYHKDDTFEVNYDMHWVDLAVRVLANAKNKLCVCSAALVAECLDPPRWSQDRGSRTKTAVCTFEVTNLRIDHHGVMDIMHLEDTQSHQQDGCTNRLLRAVKHMFSLTSLPGYLSTQNPASGGVRQLSAALRELMNMEENKRIWHHYPEGASCCWCSFGYGWSIGLRDGNMNSCSICISLSTLSKVVPVSTLCFFSDTR
jgi:hypothetical protein